MPQGMEKTISPQEFADLLAYLKGEWLGAGDAAVAELPDAIHRTVEARQST